MNNPKLTIIDNGDGSITVDRNGSYTRVLSKHGGGGVESLAYEMAAMLAQAPAPVQRTAILDVLAMIDEDGSVINTRKLAAAALRLRETLADAQAPAVQHGKEQP